MVKIIAVTYGHDREVDVFLNSLILQTCGDWELWLVHDGIPPKEFRDKMRKYTHERRIHFEWSSQRVGNWGHSNRGAWLNKIQADADDYILMTNADNYYVPIFIETMLGKSRIDSGKADMVYCDTIHSHFEYRYHTSEVYEGGIDLGAFMVRGDIAKSVGFNWTHFSADGRYAQTCGTVCETAVHIHMGLFIHN